jgi:hypothetical protein
MCNNRVVSAGAARRRSQRDAPTTFRSVDDAHDQPTQGFVIAMTKRADDRQPGTWRALNALMVGHAAGLVTWPYQRPVALAGQQAGKAQGGGAGHGARHGSRPSRRVKGPIWQRTAATGQPAAGRSVSRGGRPQGALFWAGGTGGQPPGLLRPPADSPAGGFAL